MPRCFVMQPFDGGEFDRRFDEVYKPAIEEAGFEPYRVDRDPSASVPIENIEGGIQGSVACFADVTIDNPNVWFELGYAMLFVLRSRYALSADRRGNAFRLTFSIERLS